MTYLNNVVDNINPATRTEHIGPWVVNGDPNGTPITLDQDLGLVFKFLRVRTVGDIEVKGIDGNSYLVIDAQPGEWHPCFGTAVLSGKTTATGIFWYGGA